MKIKVTMPKAHTAQGEPIPVGTILDVEGDEIPAFLVNKAVAVEEEKPVEEKPVDTKSASDKK